MKADPRKSAEHNKRQFVDSLAEAFTYLFGKRATVTTDYVKDYVGSPFATFVLAVQDAIPEAARTYLPTITADQVKEHLRPPRGSGLRKKKAGK